LSEPTFIPNRTSLIIMEMIHGYFTRTRKHWSLISQEWLLDRMSEWKGYTISRSALNYNLRILRKQGLIETVTRHKRDPVTGQFLCQVTLYKMAKKLRQFFFRIASYFKRIGWVPELKTLKSGYVPAVGAATTRAEVFAAFVRERRRRRSG